MRNMVVHACHKVVCSQAPGQRGLGKAYGCQVGHVLGQFPASQPWHTELSSNMAS